MPVWFVYCLAPACMPRRRTPLVGARLRALPANRLHCPGCMLMLGLKVLQSREMVDLLKCLVNTPGLCWTQWVFGTP